MLKNINMENINSKTEIKNAIKSKYEIALELLKEQYEKNKDLNSEYAEKLKEYIAKEEKNVEDFKAGTLIEEVPAEEVKTEE
jgi:hypothetical protein